MPAYSPGPRGVRTPSPSRGAWGSGVLGNIVDAYGKIQKYNPVLKQTQYYGQHAFDPLHGLKFFNDGPSMSTSAGDRRGSLHGTPGKAYKKKTANQAALGAAERDAAAAKAKAEADAAAALAAQRNGGSGGSGGSGAAYLHTPFDQWGQEAINRINPIYSDLATRQQGLAAQQQAASLAAQQSIQGDLANRYKDMQGIVSSGNADMTAQGYGPSAAQSMGGNLELQALQNAGNSQSEYARRIQEMNATNAAAQQSSMNDMAAAQRSGIWGAVNQGKIDEALANQAAAQAAARASASAAGSGQFGPGSFKYAKNLAAADAMTPYERAIMGTQFNKQNPLLQTIMQRLARGGNPAQQLAQYGGSAHPRITNLLNPLVTLYNKQPTYGLEDIMGYQGTVAAGRGSKKLGL